MEDVARAARVSRMTVYDHFTNKTELMGEVVEHEGRRMSRDAARGFDLSAPSDELVATAELALLTAAERSLTYTPFIAPEALGLTLNAPEHRHRINRVVNEYWHPVLDELERRGHLRHDATRPEIMAWIMSIHVMLLTRPAALADDAPIATVETLRRFLAPVIISVPPRP